MQAKQVHRLSAIILIVFIVTHLAVHLTALAGPAAHLSTLDAVQWIYRNPIGEIILVAAILTQIVTGARRLRFKQIKSWARLQAVSGIYLMVFLLLHTSAALYTHHIFGVETDFYWAAGSLHFSPIKYGFALYYFFAVLAVFVHLAAALHFGWSKFQKFARALPLIGAAIGISILTAFSGQIYAIDIPDDVASYYEKNFGALGLKPSRE